MTNGREESHASSASVKLGGYRLGERVGESGRAAHYRVASPGAEGLLIKVYARPVVRLEEVTDSVRARSEALRGLLHPRVASFHGLHEELGRQYAVMDYVDGMSWNIELPEDVLAKATGARLRVVIDQGKGAQVTVNGGEPIAIAADLPVFDLPLDKKQLKAGKNELKFVGPERYRLITASILLDGVD